MKRLKIAIDCDDVIVPTASLILQHYNKTYGTSVGLENYYQYNLEVYGVSETAEAIGRIEEYLYSDEYRNAEPFLEAIGAVQELGEAHELHVVTGRNDHLTEATESMLEKYFPEIFKSVEFTNFFGEKSRSKADVCRELGADILIDDHLHHAKVVAECGVQVLLFGDYPWNTAEELPENIERVRDWQEVVKRLL